LILDVGWAEALVRFGLGGAVAVLTGAAGGIGAALAGCLARRGCHLALVDRNAAGLETLAEDLKPFGVNTSVHVLDVADRDAVAALPDAVTGAHGRTNLLVNNAGVAIGGTFAHVSAADMEWLFEINFWGPVRLTRAFLPVLARERAAQIVNMSSMFGLVAPPGQAAYCASKFALRGFSESLRHELEDGPIGVTIVHPAGVRTDIANNARLPAGVDEAAAKAQAKAFNAFLRIPPEDAALAIADAVERRQKRLLIGRDARVADVLQRMFPARYWDLMKSRVGRQ
jgi:short-subunit dehydrogenase